MFDFSKLRPQQLGLVLSAGLILAAVNLAVSGQTPNRTPNSSPAPASPKATEWRDWAGSPEGNRFVPLSQITKANVGQLDVAWIYPYAQTTVNPLVAQGVIYTVARNKSIVALDAATGHEIWIHDGLTGMTERGINYWESKDGKDRRIIFNANDYVQELDASTGKIIRSFGKNGVVDRRDELGRNPDAIRVQSATPGKVFEDLIIFGSGPGEAYFSAPGDLQAYNVITGKLAWQFHVIPHPGEFGYETWPKDAWKYVGAANVWGEISVDSARGIVYFPTGSPTYDFYGADRVGDGLFGNCLLALDARTGKRLWHFQNVHHDLWDWDNVAAPQLTTITQNGRKVDVVALAGKTGFLYVFDRVTGQPIWPIEERKVPTKTGLPGEVPSPTQPFPTAPPPFARQTFTVDDINPYILTPRARAELKEQVAKARNEGLFTPMDFQDVVMMPGHHGGANWGMTSANPNDGTVYVISFNAPAIVRVGSPNEQGGFGGGGRGGPGGVTYTQSCAQCHGQDRAGTPAVPGLANITTKLSAAEIRTIILQGKSQMPAFPQLPSAEVDQLIEFLATPQGGGGFGRGGGPTSFPPGPIAETGPAATRPGAAAGRGGGRGGALPDYPEGVDHPANRLQMVSPGGGLDPEFIGPPYTTLTAYDLNKGTIKWQIGLGDDYRVVAAGGPKGTGGAELLKSSVIATSSGLLFVNAADRKIHIYDSETGKQLHELWLGATSSGSPSMFELNGRQYLLVTAGTGTRIGGQGKAADPNQAGPTGLIAYRLR